MDLSLIQGRGLPGKTFIEFQVGGVARVQQVIDRKFNSPRRENKSTTTVCRRAISESGIDGLFLTHVLIVTLN